MPNNLWPLVLQQDATDLETGRRYTQTLSVTSIDHAIASELVTRDFFSDEADTDELVMVIVTDSEDEGGGAFVTAKDELLAWAIGLARNLTEDLGPMRAKEAIEEAGGAFVEIVPTPMPFGDDSKGKA